MEWLNFRHLYAFWMVHQCGGFRNAADEMHISQSTISDQVRQLEDYFESALFERTTRYLKLSPAGYQLIKFADDIFHKSREINRFFLEDDPNTSKRSLKVGIVGGVSRNLVYEMTSRSIESGNNIQFEVYNGSLSELTVKCLNFEIDLIISTQLPSGKELSSLKAELIGESAICLAGKKKTLKKLEYKKSTTDIKVYSFLYPYLKRDPLEEISAKYKKPIELALETDDISLLRFYANSGQGLAIVPEVGVKEDLDQGKIESLPLKAIEPAKFYAFYPKKSYFKQEIRNVLEQAPLL